MPIAEEKLAKEAAAKKLAAKPPRKSAWRIVKHPVTPDGQAAIFEAGLN